MKISEFLLWLIFWLTAEVAVWIPDLTTKVANILGIGRGADLVFYLIFILLFYLIFRIYVKIEKIERDITKVVREDALNNKTQNSEHSPERPGQNSES